MVLLLMASLANAQSLADRFFDEYYFPFNPTAATAAGVHSYDGRLEDYSRTGFTARTAALRKFEAQFARGPAGDDRDLILSHIRASLLDLETIRNWEKNPDLYSSGISNSAYVIMSRTFAPPETRLRALIERERGMPKALAGARENLKNPPRIFTEVALEQLPAIIAFFEKDVPLAFQPVTDAALLAEFRPANAAVVEALRDYEKFLRTRLLPRSHGDFRSSTAGSHPRTSEAPASGC